MLSFNQLLIAEAYIHGNIDFEGNMIQIFSLQRVIPDEYWGLKLWRRFQPMFFSHNKLRPQWVAKHYDADNIQLFAVDHDYQTYTPGLYEHDEDSLEDAAERKLAYVFDSLQLQPGNTVIDVGCGWGGFLRYAARRDVHVTGITLSRNQKEYVERLIYEEHLDAEVLYQDFYTFQPSKPYDALCSLGVLEHLPDYQRVIRQCVSCVKPGKRLYLDFFSSVYKDNMIAFINKYVWSGPSKLAYMPEMMEAIGHSPLEILTLESDRHNYYLWLKKLDERWQRNKEAVIQQADETLWRIFHIVYAGMASMLCSPIRDTTAYRMTLELPVDAKLTQ